MKRNYEIDRDSYEPAYAQLVRIVRQQMASGDLRPGSQLPSESNMCAAYGISPMTVRRAINLLVEQGVVRTVKGRGTFVRGLEIGDSHFDLHELQSLFENKASTKVKILEVRIVSAEEKIAEKLGIPAGERVIYLRRLIIKKAEPVLYHAEYLRYNPKTPVVESQMDVTSLNGLFRSSGESEIKNGILNISCSLVNQEVAPLLNLEENSAVLRLEHMFYNFDDVPVSFGWFIFSSTAIRFSAKVGIWD